MTYIRLTDAFEALLVETQLNLVFEKNFMNGFGF